MSSPGSRWCPSCGDEYEPRITTCIDCRVSLVDHQPEVLDPVVRVDDELIEPTLRFDISPLISEQREELLEYLAAVPIPFLLVDDDTLEALPGYEDELTAAVMGPSRPTGLRSTVSLEGKPLDLWRRLVSLVIDGIVAVLVAFLALRWIADGGVAALVVLALLFVNQVVGVGERARSIGKWCVGARIRSTGGGPLTLGEATVRWLLKDGISMIAIAIAGSIDEPTGVWLALEVFAACYFVGLVASVLVDPQLRGIHDRLVDSAVVSSDSVLRRAV